MSATIIKILNSGTSGSPSSLATGELAYSYLSGTLINGGDRLYIGTGTETNGEAANIEVIGGKYFTEMLDHTKGVLTANSALIVDANGKLDILNVDNITLNGNTISTTNTNGDLIIDPDGTGQVQVSSDLYVTGDLNVDGALGLGSDVVITGTLQVDGTADFNDQVTIASLNVEDLTSGRVVYVSTSGELVDSDQLKFNGSTLVVGYDSLTPENRLAIDTATGNLSTIGNITVGGTLGVTGESTLASATISDLTSTRIVIAGTSGSLEDSADFTFDGTEFNVGQGNFTVQSASGNTQIVGTLNVDGQSTLASLNVEDLTATRVVYVGTNGELVDSADMVFTGTGATSQLQLIGKLNVDAQSTLASVNVEDLTNNRIVIAGTSGELEDDANFTFDGTTFDIGQGNLTVDVATGDLYVAGSQVIDGQSTLGSLNILDLTATRVLFAGTDGEVVDSADFAFVTGTSTLNLTGQLNVDNIRVDGNAISATNTDGNVTISPNGVGYIDLTGSQAVKIPVGTLAQRPSGVQGQIRFNITDGRFEGFDGTAWNGLGGVIDVDQNTFVRAETSPGANNNDLEFYTDGVKRVNLDENGMVFTDDTIPLQVGQVKIQGTTISTLTGYSTMYLDPADPGITGTVVIQGNLQVNGTTTTINSTEVTIDDPVFVLGGDTAPEEDDNRDRGIAYQWHDGVEAKLGFFGWDDSAGRFTFIPDATDATSVFTGSAGDVAFGNALVDSMTFGTFTSNGVMFTDNAGDVQFAASSTEGHVLQINASGVPVFGIIDCGTY